VDDGRPFADRRDAGRQLAARLTDAGRAGAVPLGPDALVLGLPRGGVLVAVEVAAALGAELDVVAVRKLGLPGRPELAMGALAAVGDTVESVRSEAVLASVTVDAAAADEVRRAELAELRRRQQAYRGDRPPPDLAGRTVVLVDDGLATGSTARAALTAVRGAGAAAVVVAVPVGAVGRYYDDFGETTDAEVRAALTRPPA
jgi:putative phosphoribosyl transferase